MGVHKNQTQHSDINTEKNTTSVGVRICRRAGAGITDAGVEEKCWLPITLSEEIGHA
jgi:hypothetical protein